MEKKRIIEVEGISEEMLKVIAANLGEDIDTNESFIWFGLEGDHTIKSATYVGGGKYWLTDYGVSNQELRDTTAFLVACLNNGEVNSTLDTLYHGGEDPDASITDENLADLFEWASGKTNIPPVTTAGLYTYVMEYLHLDFFTLDEDDCKQLFG